MLACISYKGLFTCNVKALQKLQRKTVGVFADLTDGVKAVSVIYAEHGAEREARTDLFELDLTAVTRKLGEEITKRDLWQMIEERFRRKQEGGAFLGRHCLERLKRIGVFQGKRTRFRTNERGHDAAATELPADIGAERTDISSLGAENAHGVISTVALNIQLVNGDRSRFSFDYDAASGKIDELFAADLQCAVHRGDLHDLSNESLCRIHDDLAGRDRFTLCEDVARDVLAVRGQTEAEARNVFLILFRQKFRSLDRSADEDGKKSRGDGIERTRVADLTGSVQTAYARNYVKGRYAVGLMDQKNTVTHGSRIPL